MFYINNWIHHILMNSEMYSCDHNIISIPWLCTINLSTIQVKYRPIYLALYHATLQKDISRLLWQMWQCHLKPFTREGATAVKAPIQQMNCFKSTYWREQQSSSGRVWACDPLMAIRHASTRPQAQTYIYVLLIELLTIDLPIYTTYPCIIDIVLVL